MVSSILFLVILIALNAFFAASEMALISLNDNKVKMMADDGDKKAKQLLKLLGEPSRFLATIQIGITLAGFLASAFAAESFADPLVSAIKRFNFNVSDDILKIITVMVITVLLAYFTLVLGELVPKRVAMKKSEGIAFFVVAPLMILSKITSPFVKLLTASTNFFVRLFGIDPNDVDDDVTEEEIRMLIDVGEEKGAIHESEKIMINNIFEFNNKIAADIMTHRMEIVSISASTKLIELVNLIEMEKYTRIPVYEESMDNIIGILHVKDLIPLINKESQEDFDLKDYIRKPIFVQESKKIDQLFIELQMAKTHIAFVIDEYGGIAGIVTLEDLVEEIVGNIFDEYDEEELEIKRLDDNTYEVSGMMSLDELEKPLGVELPLDEYETFSGFVIGLIGRIPLKEEKIEIDYKNLRIEILDVTEKRIEKILVHVERLSDGEAEKVIQD